MALSDKLILEHMEKSNIIIDPFKRDSLNTSSYDVTLGNYYFREQKPKHYHFIYNPYDRAHVEHVWGEPQEAGMARQEFKKLNFDWQGIAPEDRVIMLGPGEMILAHTQEFIGGRNCITTQMQGRSSTMRNWISVCKCAGWGDVGYFNRWTMEITNHSTHYTIPLVVGRRYAQIVFLETGPILGDQYGDNGKYTNTSSLEDLKMSWKPEMMLPRMYNDREISK